MTARSYCITIFDMEILNSITQKLEDNELVRYCVWQVEETKTKRKHIQAYIELKSPRKMSYIKKLFEDETLHCEKRKGTREEARNYCMKEESRLEGPFEYGSFEKGGQGKRNDLLDIKKKVDEKVSVAQIWDEHFGTMIRVYKGVKEYKSIKTKQTKFEKKDVHIYWGKTGSGKTRKAFEENKSIYIKDESQWWDGYDGEECVLIDDFNGGIPIQTLLKICDGYPYQGQIKGGYVNITCKKVIITSNTHIGTWYPKESEEHHNALLRRVSTDLFME